MREATLCLPVQGEPIETVLLGFKKRGFGQGNYTGFGGKVEAGETVTAAAVRELAEESGIVVTERQLTPRGTVTFRFPAKPTWDQRVHLFLVREWTGAPMESAEMRPYWFRRTALPFDQMWQDAAHWLPLILADKSICATFVFQNDNKTLLNFSIVS